MYECEEYEDFNLACLSLVQCFLLPSFPMWYICKSLSYLPSLSLIGISINYTFCYFYVSLQVLVNWLFSLFYFPDYNLCYRRYFQFIFSEVFLVIFFLFLVVSTPCIYFRASTLVSHHKFSDYYLKILSIDTFLLLLLLFIRKINSNLHIEI